VRREWAGPSGDGRGRDTDVVDATPMEMGSRSKSEDIEVEVVWGGSRVRVGLSLEWCCCGK
jgi:hypothetical protein